MKKSVVFDQQGRHTTRINYSHLSFTTIVDDCKHFLLMYRWDVDEVQKCLVFRNEICKMTEKLTHNLNTRFNQTSLIRRLHGNSLFYLVSIVQNNFIMDGNRIPKMHLPLLATQLTTIQRIN